MSHGQLVELPVGDGTISSFRVRLESARERGRERILIHRTV
jgi:hypothetical protein